MPDTKITALTALTAADPANDVLPIVDVSDTTMAASGTTKKISINNVLGCSGTATLASATITGDLTVDTSTLYVSSSTDKVAIGTTSLSNEKLTVAGNISANAWLGRSNISAPTGDCSIFRSADNTLGFGIASSTAMTLNSTGLGVGTSPATKLDVRGANNANQATFSGTAGRGLLISTRSDGLADDRTVVLNAQYATGSLGQLAFQTAGTDRVLMKNNGQLRFVPLAADPAGAEAGDVYYNSTSNKLKCYNGTTWNDLF